MTMAVFNIIKTNQILHFYIRTVSYSLDGNKNPFVNPQLHIAGQSHSFTGLLIKLIFLDCGRKHMHRDNMQTPAGMEPATIYEEKSAVLKFSG